MQVIEPQIIELHGAEDYRIVAEILTILITLFYG